jgi:hypothetical protein
VSDLRSRRAGAWLLAGLIGVGALPGCPEPEAVYDRPEPHQIIRVAFSGAFYVEADTTDFKVVERVRRETQASLLALRKAKVVIASKGDLAGLDIKRVTKEPVTVIGPSGAKRPAIRVRFRYVDQAVVPASMAARDIVQLPLLQRDDEAFAAEILADCTSGEAGRVRDPMKTLTEQYDPTLPSCKGAMAAEQQQIDSARAALPDPQNQAVQAEFDRIYAPLVAALTSLEPGATNQQIAPSYEVVEPGSGISDPAGPGRSPDSPSKQGGSSADQPGGAGTADPSLRPLTGDVEARRAKAAATAAANVDTIKPSAKPPPKSTEIESEPLDFSMLSDPKFLLVGVALLALFPLLRKSKA